MSRWGVSLLVLFLATFTLPVPGQQPPAPVPPATSLRVDVEVVNVYCTVKNLKGGLVTDLALTDFEVQEDGRRQPVRYFARETNLPLSLVLLVDTSPSQSNVLANERAALVQFLRQVVRRSDRALLITFADHLDLMQDFTADAERWERALARLRVDPPPDPGPASRVVPGGTRLYDALYLAASEKLMPAKDRKAIVVISDGVDRGSRKTKKQALQAVQRSDTLIYAIGIADPGFYWRAENRAANGGDVLRELAEATGGQALFPSRAQKLSAAFDQIAAELRSQYRLGYTPANRARDGRFRRLAVRVNRVGLRVQARRGYYAPSS